MPIQKKSGNLSYAPRISKIECRNAINVERASIKDEIVLYSAYIISLKTCLHTFWKKAWTSFSFFDIFRFSKYLSYTGNNTKDKTLDKNKSFLHFLIKKQFSCVLTSDKHIFDYSSMFCRIVKSWFWQEDWIFVPPPSSNIDSVTIFSECCVLTFWPGQKCHSGWCTERKWHILIAVMRGNRDGGNWLMKCDEIKNSHGTLQSDAPEESDLRTAWQLFPLDETFDFKDRVGVKRLYNSVEFDEPVELSSGSSWVQRPGGQWSCQ